MPRLHHEFLYPEETDKAYTTKSLVDAFQEYTSHAKRIRNRYNSKDNGMNILVGFEVEGIDLEHIMYAKELFESGNYDMVVGSVHHVNGVPIDYTTEIWNEAVAKTHNQTVRQLYSDYFELQYTMISTLHPLVIGHFDLISLFMPLDDIDPTTNKKLADVHIESDWPDVWTKIERNIQAVTEYGGLFELNSAAVRKGWATPYPREPIARAIVSHGGRFCLSDDCHAIKQVGMNFHVTWKYVRDILKLSSIYHLQIDSLGKVSVLEDSVSDLDQSEFWKQYQ
ncbi:histidinolphosphatase [Scheffersomyces spartinae]|uniref:Histidinol-phosphatase n=1 Tax=Scheffersomyces spartinae TaxID=45513 RepID=A0A9P8AJ80_9ASCO|nr:histidinolphosphatase [Scheffersomyces spartinae]KAG7194475.1 histidinolphosphatase [Scheffersomyces spartinae]